MSGPLATMRLVESPFVPRHKILVLGGTLMVSSDTLDGLAYEGTYARWLVRRGMADVLAWLGQDVGPEPVRGQSRFRFLMTEAAARGIVTITNAGWPDRDGPAPRSV